MARTSTPHPHAMALAPPDGGSVRQRAKAMFRQAVLDAAEQVFATQGVRGARVQDIASLAGVSVGTIYNHFEQKEDIVGALISDRERQLRRAFEPQPDDPADFAGALRARSGRVMALVREHRHFYAFALYEGIFESDLVPAAAAFSLQHRAGQAELAPLLEELFEQGMRQGVVERQDPVRLKHFWVGAIRGVLMAAVKDVELDPVEEGRYAIELFLRAVRPIEPGTI